MTTRDALHQLIDQLADDQTELARMCLEDLNDAADVDGAPLDNDDLAAVDRGLADLAEGRAKTLDQYERERRL